MKYLYVASLSIALGILWSSPHETLFNWLFLALIVPLAYWVIGHGKKA